MFCADDAIFVGQWNESNINTIVHVLDCFHRASGLRFNMSKSKFLRISVHADKVDQAAKKIGCVTLKTPFIYLGSKVGGFMSRIQSWNKTVEGMVTRLSKWNMKILSIGVGKRGKHFVLGGRLARGHCFQKYALELSKNIDVASKMTHCNLGYYFRRDPRGGVEHAQFDLMLEKVEGTLLANMRDKWVWSLEGSGEFSVASVKKLIDDNMLLEVASKTRWIKAMHIKVHGTCRGRKRKNKRRIKA
ncbi:hypothetical protein Tco_0472267 [Tanacetum coccineum]